MSSVDAIARADLLVTATLGHPPFTLNADVRFPAGQVVGVLGPNGAGKTTLLRGIAGLAPVRSGRIRLGERTFDDEATGEFVTPQDMLGELRADNLHMVESFRRAKDVADKAKDNATSGLIDAWTDEAERRAWFLFEISR